MMILNRLFYFHVDTDRFALVFGSSLDYFSNRFDISCEDVRNYQYENEQDEGCEGASRDEE